MAAPSWPWSVLPVSLIPLTTVLEPRCGLSYYGSLPEAVKATGTTKVFNQYLTCTAYSPRSQRIACVGDKGVKVMVRQGADLEVLIDHTLEYELTVGHCINHCGWDDTGNGLVMTSTDGYLWCFDFKG